MPQQDSVGQQLPVQIRTLFRLKEHVIGTGFPHTEPQFSQFVKQPPTLILQKFQRHFSIVLRRQCRDAGSFCQQIDRPRLSGVCDFCRHFLIGTDAVTQPKTGKGVQFRQGFQHQHMWKLRQPRNHGNNVRLCFRHIAEALVQQDEDMLFCGKIQELFQQCRRDSGSCGVIGITQHQKVIISLPQFVQHGRRDLIRKRHIPVCHVAASFAECRFVL